MLAKNWQSSLIIQIFIFSGLLTICDCERLLKLWARRGGVSSPEGRKTIWKQLENVGREDEWKSISALGQESVRTGD